MTSAARPEDQEAWAAEVVRSNGDDLLAYFLRRTRKPEDAADLVANLFLVVWRRRADLPLDPEAARMWCFGAARNTLREHERGTARRVALADQLRQHLGSDIDDASNPARIAEQRDVESQVRRAINGLDRGSRELVALIHWDGFTIVQAARQLGMNPSTARTRYERARVKLARLLGHPDSSPNPVTKDAGRPVPTSAGSKALPPPMRASAAVALRVN